MKLTALLFLVAASSGIASANETYTCPTHIKISSGSVEIENIPQGFESLVPQATAWLTGVNAYYGHPKKGAAIVPASTSDHGNTIHWDYAADYPEGKWISCDYQVGFARLVKRVADTTKSCTAKTRTIDRASKEIEIKFDCQ